jgi:hypothetical protein
VSADTLIETLARAMAGAQGMDPDAKVIVNAPGAEGGEAEITLWVRMRPAAKRLVDQLTVHLGVGAIGFLESALLLIVATRKLGGAYAADRAAMLAQAENVVDIGERRR